MLDLLYELPSMEKKLDRIEITSDFVDHRISLEKLLSEGREVA